jgi:hypothetical protein
MTVRVTTSSDQVGTEAPFLKNHRTYARNVKTTLLGDRLILPNN